MISFALIFWRQTERLVDRIHLCGLRGRNSIMAMPYDAQHRPAMLSDRAFRACPLACLIKALCKRQANLCQQICISPAGFDDSLYSGYTRRSVGISGRQVVAHPRVLPWISLIEKRPRQRMEL